MILCCVVCLWVQVCEAAAQSHFLGDGEKVDGMGELEGALQQQGQFKCPVCVNPVCWFSSGTITLCQANHRFLSCLVTHLCGSQPQMSRKENMYTNKAKIFHRIQSHLPVIFGSGVLWDRHFLVRSLWIFLFYPLAPWAWVNFWHLLAPLQSTVPFGVLWIWNLLLSSLGLHLWAIHAAHGENHLSVCPVLQRQAGKRRAHVSPFPSLCQVVRVKFCLQNTFKVSRH